MKWHHVRLQVICVIIAGLLLGVGISVVLQTERAKILPVDPQLTYLHHQGQAKQALHQLSAQTALLTQPDCTKLSCIALTFDDGPNPATTPQVISVLEAEHVPATFFVVGTRVGGHEAILRQMQADGDEIGNHSWSHPDLTKLPADQIKQQVQLTQNAIVAAGVSAPTLFRPPYGAINQTVVDNVQPLTIAFWNEDPKDWAAETSQQVLASAEASAKPGGVIDLHDIYLVTANALQPLIDNLRSRNFQFVTMSQLMVSYPSAGEFYGGYRP